MYRNIILLLVLYVCETWSLTLREKRRVRIFENRVLRKIFGPKRDEVTREWRTRRNEELNDPYSSPYIVRVMKLRRMRLEGHVARSGRAEVYRVFVGKREEKRPLGRHRRRWKDNMNMYLQEVGCEDIDWIELAHNRDRWRALVNTDMNLRVPHDVGNFLTISNFSYY